MCWSYELGFYFEIDSGLKESCFETFYRCSNTDCKEHQATKLTHQNYCSECASPFESFEIEKDNQFIHPYGFCEQYLDGVELVTAFDSDECDVWIYNQVSSALTQAQLPNGEIEGGLPLDLSHIDIASLIDQFKKEPMVIQFLQAFESAYGKNKISIKFGFLPFWN